VLFPNKSSIGRLCLLLQRPWRQFAFGFYKVFNNERSEDNSLCGLGSTNTEYIARTVRRHLQNQFKGFGQGVDPRKGLESLLLKPVNKAVIF
jgi:hypothetical protein